MKSSLRRKSGRRALELIEEATHLLRSAPTATLASYYIGAVPFVLGFLFFWADMSRSPFAGQHLAEAALGVALLFIWMKFCQSLFARRIRAQLAVEPLPSWNLRQSLRVAMTQTILQPFGLFIIPLSLIPALPFAWVYAFYQNATALANADSAETSALAKRAWKQARLWPQQNHLVLAILSLFAFCLFLNCCIAGFSLPGLLKTLFGVESIFSKSPWALANTTFFMAAAGMTYLAIDPILKTAYVLRCFYGESLESGEDIKAEIKRFSIAPQKLAAIFVIAFQLITSASTFAQETTVEPATKVVPSQSIPPTKLDHEIEKVIHERKYTWRMPREKAVEAETKEGVLTKFLRKIGNMLREWIKATLDWIEKMWRKFFGHRHRIDKSGGDDFSTGWITTQQVLLFTLVAVALCVLAIFVLRTWRKRTRDIEPMTTEAIQPTPDLSDENVGADQLPEDGWTKLGRELLERGEFRLAMRAFYLASLAHLAQRNLISIARFKSNRDYENELRRRAHAIPNLLPVFEENLSVLERIWYGMHEVNRDIAQQFASNVDRIKTTA